MKNPDPRFGLDKIYIAGADGVVRSAKCFAGPTTPARQLSIKLSRTPPLRGGECSVLIQQQWLQFRSSVLDRKSTRLNSSHVRISYAVFCLKKKKKNLRHDRPGRSRGRKPNGKTILYTSNGRRSMAMPIRTHDALMF